MKIIARPRQSGKTTQLVMISAETGHYIVTKDHGTARYTAMLAKDLGPVIPFPLTYDEFLNHAWNGKTIKGLLIDDLEMLFGTILGFGDLIKMATISTTDREDYEKSSN